MSIKGVRVLLFEIYFNQVHVKRDQIDEVISSRRNEQDSSYVRPHDSSTSGC